MLRKSQPNFQRYVKKVEVQAKKKFSYKKANVYLSSHGKRADHHQHIN